MKKYLLILFLSSLQGFAQSHVNSFIVNNNKLLWENVFITNAANITELIQRHPRLSITSSAGNKYKGKGTNVTYNCDGTSDYMANKFSFDFEIEVRKDKYRVSIFNLKFLKDDGNTLVSAEDYILQKGELKHDSKTMTNLDCIDIYFNKLFTMTTVYSTKL